MSDTQATGCQASGTAKAHGTRRWRLGAPKSKQTTKAGTNDTFNPVIVRIFSTTWCWLGAKCWPRCWCYSGCWYLIISSGCLHPVSILVSLSWCSPSPPLDSAWVSIAPFCFSISIPIHPLLHLPSLTLGHIALHSLLLLPNSPRQRPKAFKAPWISTSRTPICSVCLPRTG